MPSEKYRPILQVQKSQPYCARDSWELINQILLNNLTK